MLFEILGTRQVVTFTQENFVGVAADTGELLWRRPYRTQSTTTSQTPILHRGQPIEAGRGNGITAVKVSREGTGWTTENLWHTDEVSMHLSNGVASEGVLFGLSHLNSGQYFALDLDTGRVLWRSEPRQAENAAILRAGDVIFSLEDDGELVVFRGGSGGSGIRSFGVKPKGAAFEMVDHHEFLGSVLATDVDFGYDGSRQLQLYASRQSTSFDVVPAGGSVWVSSARTGNVYRVELP